MSEAEDDNHGDIPGVEDDKMKNDTATNGIPMNSRHSDILNKDVVESHQRRFAGGGGQLGISGCTSDIGQSGLSEESIGIDISISRHGGVSDQFVDTRQPGSGGGTRPADISG